MSRVLRVIGTVAAIAAAIPGPHQLPAALLATAANVGAQLTARPPAARGQASGYFIGANNPLPYLMGESYTEGVEVHKRGYGGEVDDVKNPYAFIARVLSCCGPIESMGSTVIDFSTTSLTGSVGSVQEAVGYYESWLYADQQLGERPESDALGGPWGAIPEWGSDYKLSGMAAVGWSLRWSKKGKRFAGAMIPRLGKVPQGVKVYDPRLDDTVPGGSGSCRLGDEATYVYQRNPANQAGTYAHGRYVNGVKVFGVDLGGAAIDLASWIAWANVCDANGWTVNGTIYEPGDKWNNLKRICESGAAQPVLSGGILTFDYQAPRTSLYTVTRDDLADGMVSAQIGRGWKERHNTLVPRYRSPAHQWSYQQAGAVNIAAAVTADGEIKSDERQWDLVTDVDQVTELAIYDLWQRREAGPVRLSLKPHMRDFDPGDCLTLAAELGVHPDGALKAIVRSRSVDPASAVVTIEFEGETDGKHTAALGATGTAPGTVDLPTGEDIDDVIGGGGTVIVAADEAEMLALEVPIGTQVYRSDTGETWFYNGGTSGTIADWTLLAATAAADAADVTFTPAGTIAATDVQAAIEELDDETQTALADKLEADDVGWETVEAWDFAIDGAVASVIATGLDAYDEIRVFARGVTKSDNTTLVLHVSTDGGSTFYTTSGDYKTVDSAGNEGDVSQPRLHNTNATAARTGWAVIAYNNRLPTLPIIASNGDASPRLFTADTSNPIDALRVVPGSLTGTLTNGRITIEGRLAV